LKNINEDEFGPEHGLKQDNSYKKVKEGMKRIYGKDGIGIPTKEGFKVQKKKLFENSVVTLQRILKTGFITADFLLNLVKILSCSESFVFIKPRLTTMKTEINVDDLYLVPELLVFPKQLHGDAETVENTASLHPGSTKPNVMCCFCFRSCPNDYNY
jgi:hypothetical protein